MIRRSIWKEVPARVAYERVIYDAHGTIHSGRGNTEENCYLRYYFPHHRDYIISFIKECNICKMRARTIGGQVVNKKPASVCLYEENPGDRI